MTTAQHLDDILLELDNRNYKAYKQIQGQYRFPDFTLSIDYVQGDPFASPSRLRVMVPLEKAGFPTMLYGSTSRAIAFRDYLARQFYHAASEIREKRGSGKSGLIAIATPVQQVLDRTAVVLTDTHLEARFVVGLPARGRTILGRQAAELLCDDLPTIVEQSLYAQQLDLQDLQCHVETVEDADWLRQQLTEQGLVAFLADGSILPRRSGVDDRPLNNQVIPFSSPDSLRVTFDCPNRGKVSGLGIPQGVTLIVGGGYHGKSTLLRAIATGIYNHVPGDGRDYVVTDPTAVKIRAEDGRSIVGVNISPFINRLPQDRSTTCFSTENASGSTSQAASIIEALEVGTKLLLVDEDTSATNFMIRDRRMQALIAKDNEPITPFIDKIRQLHTDCSVSTVLVMGGSGDYFDVADTVIAMTEFVPTDVTPQAKAIANDYRTDRQSEGGTAFGTLSSRQLILKRSRRNDDPRGPKLKVRGVDELVINKDEINLLAVEQLVDADQVRAIGQAIAYLQTHELRGDRTVAELVEMIQQRIKTAGFDDLFGKPQGDAAQFRVFELAAALNRWRSLSV